MRSGKTKLLIDRVVGLARRLPGLKALVVYPSATQRELRVELPNGSEIEVKSDSTETDEQETQRIEDCWYDRHAPQ